MSDRLRRAVVGLGSVALAGGLGLAVHFIASDRIAPPAHDLAGGDALAMPEIAQAAEAGPDSVGRAAGDSAGKAARAPELVAGRRAASSQRSAGQVESNDGGGSAAEASAPTVSGHDQPARDADAPPAPAPTASEGVQISAGVVDTEPPAAVETPLPEAEDGSDTGSGGSVAPPSAAAPDTEAARSSLAGEIEPEHEGKPDDGRESEDRSSDRE